MFQANRPAPGITHIQDCMGVCFTLIEGKNRALLFDTGYGISDCAAYVRSLTELPVKVILSHGHHDHVLGAAFFPETYMCEADLAEFRLRTGEEQRSRVKQQAEAQGIPVPAGFLTAPIAEPKPLRFPEKLGEFALAREELGGREVWIIHVPGHTPGSVVMYIPDGELLLTGDDWNPCTWMWFPSSTGAQDWRDRMKTLIRLIEKTNPVRTVICSHQSMPRSGEEMKNFLAEMTDERLREAPAADMGSPIRTHEARISPEDWLVFDMDKIRT